MKYSKSELLSLVGEANVEVLTRDLQAISDESLGAMASVVLATPDRCIQISIGDRTDSNKRLWLDIGCASKLLTMMALCHEFSYGSQFLCESIGDYLNVQRVKWLSEISIRQLLNHTHGIDEPSDWELPISPEGMIDVPFILAGMGRESLSSSGGIYSYSSVGPWLLAALLESKVGKPFLEIIRGAFPNLLPPDTEGRTLCPANGNGVEVDGMELLRQMVQLTSLPPTPGMAHIALGSSLIQTHPGWHPTELGVASGWKAYCGDWFGHQSVLHGRSDVNVRVSPTIGLGVLVASVGGQQAKIIQGMFDQTVFGAVIRPPGLPKKGEIPVRRRPGARDLGQYCRIDSCLEVCFGSGSLEMKVTRKVSGCDAEALGVVALKPIGESAYMVSPPVPSLNLYIVEFLRNQQFEATHLWNAGRVWRKVG